MPRAKKAVAESQADGSPIFVESLLTLKYSAEDVDKLDQFAIGLLRDGTGSYEATDAAFVNRVKSAYLRAEVMLTIRNEIAALEAE